MTTRNSRRLIPCLLLALVGGVAPFTTPHSGKKVLLHKPQTQTLFAYQASSPFDYRDHKTSEEAASSPVPATSSAASRSKAPHTDLSMPLIRAIWFNQAAILVFSTSIVALLSFIMSGGINEAAFPWIHHSGNSLFGLDPTVTRLLEGFLATIPMIALGRTVEQSDQRDASHVNFSTTNMVMSLFGRRKSTEDPDATTTAGVMLLAGAIALSTGISEELVFRGYIPNGIEMLTHSFPLAAAGQAALFALGHISPKSDPGENKIIGSLQFMNALWYSLVFAATGGDIIPCIVAHTLYDMHVLCETWHTINNQMDYTQEAFQGKIDEVELKGIQLLQEEAGPSLSSDMLNFARRFFYAFDYEQKGSLSLADVQRAVTYAFMKEDRIPPQSQVEDVFGKILRFRDPATDCPGDRMTVSECLRLLFFLKSTSAATR